MIPSAFRNETILLFLNLSFKNPRAWTHTSEGVKGAGWEMYVPEREQLGLLLPRECAVPWGRSPGLSNPERIVSPGPVST